MPEHAKNNRAKHDDKGETKDEEEKKFEAEPAPCEMTVPSPDGADGGLTSGDDVERHKLESGADIKHDDADDAGDEEYADDNGNDQRLGCGRDSRHVALSGGVAQTEAATDFGEEGYGGELEKGSPLKGAEEERFGSLDCGSDAFAGAEWSHRGVGARVPQVSPLT